MKGPDLTDRFLTELKRVGVSVQPIESRSGKVVYSRIADRKCYLRHANLSNRRYYFGFATKDVLRNDLAKKAVLICGDRDVEHVFIMDFSYLTSVLRQGQLVGKKRAVYQEYQATIFPERDSQMSVTGTNGIMIDVKRFVVPLSRVLHAITT
jgi:hypothetical protein